MGLLNEWREVFRGPQFHGREWDFDDAEDLTSFTNTAIAGGSFAVAAGVKNGVLRGTGAATTDNSGAQIQHEGFPVFFDARGAYICQARLDPSVIAVEFQFGWMGSDTSLVASAPTDGVFIHQEPDGALSLKVIRDGGAVSYSLGQGDADAHDWAILVDTQGALAGTVSVYRDNDCLLDRQALTAIPYDAALGVSVAMQSGSATGTQTLDVDYIRYRGPR